MISVLGVAILVVRPAAVPVAVARVDGAGADGYSIFD